MQARLTYVMKFVADMDRAVRFHRDTLGLSLKFQSPGWSEFSTGEVTLALHPATEGKPAGSVELGFQIPDLEARHARGRGERRELCGPVAARTRHSRRAVSRRRRRALHGERVALDVHSGDIVSSLCNI